MNRFSPFCHTVCLHTVLLLHIKCLTFFSYPNTKHNAVRHATILGLLVILGTKSISASMDVRSPHPAARWSNNTVLHFIHASGAFIQNDLQYREGLQCSTCAPRDKLYPLALFQVALRKTHLLWEHRHQEMKIFSKPGSIATVCL